MKISFRTCHIRHGVIKTLQIIPLDIFSSNEISQSTPVCSIDSKAGRCHFSAMNCHSCFAMLHLTNGWKLSSGSIPHTWHWSVTSSVWICLFLQVGNESVASRQAKWWTFGGKADFHIKSQTFLIPSGAELENSVDTTTHPLPCHMHFERFHA